MKTSALILMLASYITVTAVTIFFFVKVLTTPHKPEEGEEHIPEVKSFDVT